MEEICSLRIQGTEENLLEVRIILLNKGLKQYSSWEEDCNWVTTDYEGKEFWNMHSEPNSGKEIISAQDFIAKYGEKKTQREFQVGDRVKIVKKCQPSGDLWISSMDQYIGRTTTIKSFKNNSHTWVILNNCDSWNFPIESLELITPVEETQKIVVDPSLFPYLNNYKKLSYEDIRNDCWRYLSPSPNKSYYGVTFPDPFPSIKPKRKGIMSRLKALTNFVQTNFKQPLKNYYRLGWVEIYNDELVVTSAGRDAYITAQMIGDGDLAKKAVSEVTRLKKIDKEDDED